MEENLFKKPIEEQSTDALTRAFNEAAAESARLQDQLAGARKLERLLGELSDYRGRGWTLHIKAICEKEKDFLKNLREAGHPAIQQVEQLYLESKSSAEKAIHLLPGELERSAKNADLMLDFARSQHPRYRFEEDGYLEVEILDKKLEARIGTREGPLAKIPADAGAIINVVAKEKARLFLRPYSGSRFLGDLRSAYLAALKPRKMTDGEPVPLREVFQAMLRKNKSRKNYKLDEFLIDLSRLVFQGPAETNGYRFELQQTKDTQEGMLLLGGAGRGMVKLLIFKKSNPSPP